jgi:chemotaxis protein methyltransferase CheR
LLKAERGRYSQLEINRGLPAVLLSRYFTRQGIEWEIVKDIRDKVEFRSLNLADSWPTMPAMDIILLRNVLIYFDVEKKKQILAKVRRLLCRDGYMLMGGAETTLNLDENYERVRFENTAYYRLRS